MEWRHNLVTGDSRMTFMGAALTTESPDSYSLWMCGADNLTMRRLKFNGLGVTGSLSTEADPWYDALLPHAGGYVLTSYRDGSALVTGHAPDHRELWRDFLPDADSPRWSLAEDATGKLHLLYGSCNPHDGYRQAHVAVVEPGGDKALRQVFTVPDEDYPQAALLIAQPERLAVCVRNRGTATVFYILGPDAEVIRNGAFAAHPHCRWCVPLCQTPLADGDILMGGYREETPGRRRAWACRFDADLCALNGRVIAGEAEQAVTAFAPQPDGSVLALCPPWRIWRLSPKGLPTHAWEMPPEERRNTLTAMLAAPGGGCFFTGRSFSRTSGAPAVLLGKLGLNEFTEL